MARIIHYSAITKTLQMREQRDGTTRTKIQRRDTRVMRLEAKFRRSWKGSCVSANKVRLVPASRKLIRSDKIANKIAVEAPRKGEDGPSKPRLIWLALAPARVKISARGLSLNTKTGPFAANFSCQSTMSCRRERQVAANRSALCSSILSPETNGEEKKYLMKCFFRILRIRILRIGICAIA